MATYRVIGTSPQRFDGVAKVTGTAQYAADVPLPGVLWGKVLHSPYPHARILGIDTSEARQLPGVHAVLTGADVHGLYGRLIRDLPVLARDRVRFAGERVAAVAAESEDIAQHALDLIVVDYEELPAVLEPEDALRPGAPVLHPDFNSYAGIARPLDGPSNAYSTSLTERGDVEQGFAEADLVVEGTYRASRVHQAYLETQTVAIWLDEGRVNVWACSKVPYAVKDQLAAAVGIDRDSIVIQHSYIGGDFGGKGAPPNLPICYELAKATGRPVRMVPDYIEELLAGNPRHATSVRLKTGVNRDGTIVAHEVDFVVNCGAYAAFKPRGVIGGANQAAGAYRAPNCRVRSTHVYTNTVPGGHMRAPGEPQGVFGLESHIDEVARQLGMDPVEFRLKNLVQDGDETLLGERFAAVRAHETLKAAAEAAGYGSPKPANVGRGVAIAHRGPGGGEGSSEVTLKPGGGIAVATPIFEQGTGTYGTLRQVVAEEFEVAPESIDVEVWNTDVLESDSGIGGARGTRVNSAAAYEAVQAAKTELLRLASERLGWPLERLVLRGDQIRRTDTEEVVAWPAFLTSIGEEVSGRGHVQDTSRAPVTAFTAQAAEVLVDPETGQVKVLHFVSAHDVGRVLNPVGHQGQVNGGFMQGLGQALMEELQLDGGRVTTLSLGDYKIPTMRDAPRLTTVLLESETGVGPYDVKAIGEGPIGPVAPAIANAIADAVGVRITSLPLTAEKVYRALREREAGR